MPAGNEQARIVLAGRWRYRLYLTPYSEKRLDVLAGYLSGILPRSGKTGAGSVAYSRQVNTAENGSYPFAPAQIARFYR